VSNRRTVGNYPMGKVESSKTLGKTRKDENLLTHSYSLGETTNPRRHRAETRREGLTSKKNRGGLERHAILRTEIGEIRMRGKKKIL